MIRDGRSRREATTDEKDQQVELRAKRSAKYRLGGHEDAADPHPVYQKESEKDHALGYAGLDAGNRVPVARLPPLIGDSGSGGVAGLVPAPAAGDAAADKFLKADGTWATAGGGSGLTPLQVIAYNFVGF